MFTAFVGVIKQGVMAHGPVVNFFFVFVSIGLYGGEKFKITPQTVIIFSNQTFSKYSL